MDDRDFLLVLSENAPRRRAGAEFLQHLKTAGIADETAAFLRTNSREIAGALVGAAVATGVQYVANKKGPRGEPSGQQRVADRQLAHADLNAELGDRSFGGRFSRIYARNVKDLADLYADHPGKGALTMAPVGAAAGMALTRLFKK